MWIAKSKYDGTTYGKPYKSIYQCQKYIDKYLKEESDKHRKLRALKLFEKAYNRKPTKFTNKLTIKYIADDLELKSIELSLCNGILCYNVEQERFCEGFDF